jgi:hypothetical protein
VLDPKHYIEPDLIESIKVKFDCEVKFNKNKRGLVKYSIFKSSVFKSVGVNSLIVFRNGKDLIDVELNLSRTILDLRDEIALPNVRPRSSGFIVTVESEDYVMTILEEALKLCSEFQGEVAEEELEAEEFNRGEVEANGYDALSEVERLMYDGFWEVSKKLNGVCGSIFHVDHAQSIKECGIKSIHHTNLQLLVKGINTSKSSKSWDRLSWEAQVNHIKSNVSIIPDIDTSVIELLLSHLKIYWGD